MVLWLGEYQAFTMAGCISHTSRLGCARSSPRSLPRDEVEQCTIFKTFDLSKTFDVCEA